LNKQRFNNLINNYHNISEEDRRELHELVKLYPYSQVLHTLVAKANIDAKTDIAANTLNYAAMYASDRQILKNIIQPKGVETAKSSKTEHPKAERPVEVITVNKKILVEPVKESSNENTKINQLKQIKITVDNAKISENSDLLRDEIWADLKNLKDSKANYLFLLEKSGSEESIKPTKKLAVTKVKEVANTKEEPIEGKSIVTKKTIKAAPQVKKEVVSKKKEVKKKSKSITDEETMKKSGVKGKKTPVKKNDKLKKPIKNAPLKEQIKIIDKFIDKVPSISSRQVLTINENQKDLSVASTEFGEDLVSENLALILIEQGKVQKAVDIYKKLIWKFPQKKAYFAAQIEALKK
jgi:tetratricopeptide (TPR) repeat protein